MTLEEEDAALEARYCACDEFAPGPDTCPGYGLPLCATCKLWRPEYITCVATDAAARLACCGRKTLWPTEFTFVDWAHADGNEERGGRLLTCTACKMARERE